MYHKTKKRLLATTKSQSITKFNYLNNTTKYRRTSSMDRTRLANIAADITLKSFFIDTDVRVIPRSFDDGDNREK